MAPSPSLDPEDAEPKIKRMPEPLVEAKGVRPAPNQVIFRFLEFLHLDIETVWLLQQQARPYMAVMRLMR